MWAFQRSWGWGGWKAGLFWGILLGVAWLMTYEEGWSTYAPWRPLFWFLAYGVAVVTVNRTRLRVDGEWLRVDFGPVPAGAWGRKWRREDVKRVYLRREGEVVFSGVEFASGECFEQGGEWTGLARVLGMEVAEIAGPRPGRGVLGWGVWAWWVVPVLLGVAYPIYRYGGIR